MRKLVYLFVLILFISCQQQNDIVGTWERFGDPLQGLSIEIYEDGETYKGKIVTLNDIAQKNGFEIGDIKWKNIRQTSENMYELEDLGKRPILFSDKFEIQYAEYYLEFVSENEIRTRIFGKGNELTGSEQMWKRVE